MLKNTLILGLYAVVILSVVGFALLYKELSKPPSRIEIVLEQLERFSQLGALFNNWSPESAAPQELDSFIGKTVTAFAAGPASPNGARHDLTADGLYIQIISTNQADLSPPNATGWEAKVTGEVKSIDWKNKKITLTVRPGGYMIGEFY